MRHKIPIELIYTLIAAGGGVVRHLNEYIHGKKFAWRLLVANMILSGFSGFMFGLFARSLNINGDMTLVFSGVGGFMSSTALEFLYQKLKT